MLLRVMGLIDLTVYLLCIVRPLLPISSYLLGYDVRSNEKSYYEMYIWTVDYPF